MLKNVEMPSQTVVSHFYTISSQHVIKHIGLSETWLENVTTSHLECTVVLHFQILKQCLKQWSLILQPLVPIFHYKKLVSCHNNGWKIRQFL